MHITNNNIFQEHSLSESLSIKDSNLLMIGSSVDPNVELENMITVGPHCRLTSRIRRVIASNTEVTC